MDGSSAISGGDGFLRLVMRPETDSAASAIPNVPFQQLFDNVDWSKTDVGPRETWSREIRQMVRLMMIDNDPTMLYLGPRHTMLYNEAYIPLIGNNHPYMQGKNAADVFPEFWAYFDKVLDEQKQTGLGATGESSMLFMERHGFKEETYFDWKLLPLIDDAGNNYGSYGRPSEKTNDIISARRRLCTVNLSQAMVTADSIDGLYRDAMKQLSLNEKDVPFALIYSVDEQHSISSQSDCSYACQLRASVAVPDAHTLQKQTLNISKDSAGFGPAICTAIQQRKIQVNTVGPELRKLLQGIEWKGFGEPSNQYATVPIITGDRVGAVLIVGVNPYRRCNTWYQDYLQLCSEIIGPQLEKVRLAEELRQRSAVAQRALHDFEKSETRFSRFARRSSVGLVLADVTGTILFANEAWMNFSGLKEGEIKYTNWIDTVWEDDLDKVKEWWHKVTVLKENAISQIRTKMPFQSGHMSTPYSTAICAGYADLAADGSVETVMGFIVDISELKWTEAQLLQRSKELQESEAQYRTFSELAPIGILRTDLEGTVLFSNNAWRSFYDFTEEDLKSKQPWLKHAHAEDVATTRQYFEDLIAHGGPRAIEFRLKRKFTMSEGDRVVENDAWVLATGYAEYKPDGSVDHLDFWVTDISPQKMATKILTDRMEEAIRNRTQQERFIDMISHEIRNPLSAVLHCSEEIVENMKKCLVLMDESTHVDKSIAARNIRRDEVRRLIDSALDAGNTTMYCVQHEKQIVDDVLTLSKLDSELLVVSPVPVQPMALMHSLVKIFEPELRSADIQFNIIRDKSLTEHDIDWLLIDPSRFLQIVINLITNAIKFTRSSTVRTIELQVSVQSENSPRRPGVDYVPRRYRPPMKRKSTLELLAPFSKPYHLCISISDTGKGLTPDEKKLLFNRFAQASPKTHVEYGGSGLGLFISRQITEMLGGEIGVGSSSTGGCVFAFYAATRKTGAPAKPRVPSIPDSASTLAVDQTLPPTNVLPVPTKTVNGQSQCTDATSTRNKIKQKVLVVEDNIVNQKVLCKQLRNRGFEVEAANHGQEALDALGGTRSPKGTKYFDVILCDIEMPIMNGIECVKEVRKLESIGRLPGHIPIVGVTANVRSKQVDAAIEAGMDGVTTKPYKIDDLIAHINRVCAMTIQPAD